MTNPSIEQAQFGPVTVCFGEKHGKYPDGNQLIVTGRDTRAVFDSPKVANHIGPLFDDADVVIMGHVHEDHMAGLHRLPGVPVHVHEADLEARCMDDKTSLLTAIFRNKHVIVKMLLEAGAKLD
jgi:glyoxylase-like metal-dependent hydrolase (beta-lactamase superfamily II)